MSESGYRLQPEGSPESVVEELRAEGIRRPLETGDLIDENMPAESLRVVLHVGVEHLARLAGAQRGDFVTADMVNRGMLAYVKERSTRMRDD